jgi:hypothetical protein
VAGGEPGGEVGGGVAVEEETAAVVVGVQEPTEVLEPQEVDGRRCGQCQARVAEGVRFCAECGTRQADVVEPAPPPVEGADGGASAGPGTVASAGGRDQPAGAAPGVSQVAPAASGAAVASGQSFLLPRFPFRLVWSPRKPWRVSTKLSEQDVGQIFQERMTRKANVLRQTNNYFRRVSWRVQRNAISGELTASCEADGLVEVGFARHDRLSQR